MNLNQEVQFVWEQLETRSQDVLLARDSGETLDAIASRFELTRERIRQVEGKALESLRLTFDSIKPGFGDGLARVLDGSRFVDIRGFDASHLLDMALFRVLLRSFQLRPVLLWGVAVPWLFEQEHGSVESGLAELVDLLPMAGKEFDDALARLGFEGSHGVVDALRISRAPFLRDRNGNWVRRSGSKRDSVHVWLRNHGVPASGEEVSLAVGGKSSRAVVELMRRNPDTFTQIRPEGTWVLTDWSAEATGVSFDYKDATEAVVGVLEDLGPMTQMQLSAEVVRRYPVSASRIAQCLSSKMVGFTPDGRVDLSARGAKLRVPTEPKRPDHIARSGDIIAVVVDVDAEVLRGSGIGVSPWLTWELGLHHYPDHAVFHGDYPVTVRRHSSGSALSALRAAALEMNVARDCKILVLLNTRLMRSTTRHACSSASCPGRTQ